MAGKLQGRAISNTANIVSQTITVGNSTSNSVINSTAVVTPSVNVGSNVFVNTSTIHLGNSTVNTVIHTTGFTGNGAGLHGINADSIATGTLNTSRLPATVNVSTAINVGSNLNINTSAIFIGNSTVNTTIIAGNVDLQGTQLRVGNVIVNGNQLSVGNVTITDAQISVGNSTVNTVLGSTGSLSGNGSQLTSVNAAALEGNTVANILTSANTAANTLAAAAFTNAASRADAAYSNAVSYAASNTYVNNTFAQLSGATFTGGVSGITTLAAGNTTVTGFANVVGVSNTDGFTVTRSSGVTSQYIKFNSNSGGHFVTFNSTNTNVKSALFELNSASSTGVDLQYRFRIDGAEELKINSTAVAISADLVVSGNVFFNGTTTNVNSTNLVVEDKNIIVGDVATPTDVTADGGGITLKGTTDKTITWVDSTDAWTSSEDFNLVSGKSYEINGTVVVNSTSLGTGITGSSLTSVGTLTTLAAGNTTITGFINVSTNTATFGTAVYVVSNGNVGIGMSSPIFPLQVKTNTGTPPQAFQINTTDWTTTVGSALQFGFGAATGNTYSEIRALANGYNQWNNLILQSGGGNVGIGITTPGSKLTVADAIGIKHASADAVQAIKATYWGYSTSYPVVMLGAASGGPTVSIGYDPVNNLNGSFTGDGREILFRRGAQFVTPNSSGNSFFLSNLVLLDGNVGIGTTAPANKLHLYGATGQILRIESSAADGGGFGWIGFYDAAGRKAYVGSGGNDNNFYISLDGSGGNFYLNAGGATRVIAAANGNVGIGNTAPTDILSVHSSSADSFIRMNSSNVGNTGIKISYSGSSTHGIDLFYYPNNAQCYFDSKYQASAGQIYGDIHLRQNVAGTMTSRVTIKADGGNVGIGDTTVPYKLDVNGNIGIRGANYLYLGHSSTGTDWTSRLRSSGGQFQVDVASFRIADAGYTGTITWLAGTANGNVGIATTTPINKLQVVGTIGVSDTTTGNRGRFFWTTSGFTGIGLYNDDNSSLVLGTNGTARFEVDVSGHALPYADNSYNLGSASKRWANIYTADLNMSNKGSQNDIDGTWGEWTVQEGEEDLFLINRRNGKKYQFVLKEVE